MRKMKRSHRLVLAGITLALLGLATAAARAELPWPSPCAPPCAVH